MYQKLGVIIPYDDGNAEVNHLGRYVVTQRQRDKNYLKVPTLRNIALSAPYLHGGTIETLEDIVGVMALHQLGRPMRTAEIEKIVMFLKTLTGEKPSILGED